LSVSVTDVHTRHATLEAMAAGLLAEHAGDLILCGASMGGMLAMEVARQAPQRIRGLALLGTSARPEDAATRALREAAIVLFEQGRMDEVLQANLPLAFDASRAADTALHQAYLAMIGRAGAAQLVAQNRAVINGPTRWPTSGACAAPCWCCAARATSLRHPIVHGKSPRRLREQNSRCCRNAATC